MTNTPWTDQANTSWSGDRQPFPTATRQAILRRDKWCTNCHWERATEADHIINVAQARRQGWTPAQYDDINNGQGLCATCHAAKTRQEIKQGKARMTPRRVARHPSDGVR